MTGHRSAAQYGERHAAVYDQIYGSRFAPDEAVAALATAASDGRVLELGLGTGRLAIPLIQRGVPVDGIEASPAMITQLRARPGGAAVGIFEVDLDGFTLPTSNYAVGSLRGEHIVHAALSGRPSPLCGFRGPALAARWPVVRGGVPPGPVSIRRGRP